MQPHSSQQYPSPRRQQPIVLRLFDFIFGPGHSRLLLCAKRSATSEAGEPAVKSPKFQTDPLARRGRARSRPSLRHRRPQHLFDARRAGRQHHQTVEAERNAARRRHDRQRVEKIFVDRASLAIKARAGGARLDKTAALLGASVNSPKPLAISTPQT